MAISLFAQKISEQPPTQTHIAQKAKPGTNTPSDSDLQAAKRG